MVDENNYQDGHQAVNREYTCKAGYVYEPIDKFKTQNATCRWYAFYR